MASGDSSSEHHRCQCGHLKYNHSKLTPRCNVVPCKCIAFVCDHTRCGWKPREEQEPEQCDHPDNDPCDRCLMPRSYYIKCGCGHVQGEHRTFMEGGCTNCRCKTFALPPEEPPLTPEEEEELPQDEEGRRLLQDPEFLESMEQFARGEKVSLDDPPPEGPEYDKCACGAVRAKHVNAEGACYGEDCDCVAFRPKADEGCSWPACLSEERQQELADDVSREMRGEEPPPQPERRPPYAVAYSVQGHLFEVALSGDATVRAVDGALVIQHHLGPVAGIVSVLPIINKESA